MNMNEFEDFVDRLFKSDLKPMTEMQLIMAHAMFGIATESGELLDTLKKEWAYEQRLDRENVKEEIGDLLFYIQALCSLMGLTLSSCMEANRSKLEKRYPEGYTDDAAKVRADKTDERN